MEEDQLLALAKQFVEIKAPFVDDIMKDGMAAEVRDKIDETIRLQLVSSMTPEQIDDYSELLEGDNVTDEAIIAFVNKCNINVVEVS